MTPDVGNDVSSKGEPVVEGGSLEQELDRISLNQALLDTDIATGRVVDLTRRLVEAAELIARLEGEVDALRAEKVLLEDELRTIRTTKAFRIADRVWALRRALHG